MRRPAHDPAIAGRAGRARWIGAMIPLVALWGCATITYEAPLIEGMVAMNRAAPEDAYEEVGAFEADRRAVFVIAQLITAVDGELEDVLRRELARTDGDAVINLRIHEEYDFIDVLIGVVAGGIVNSRTVTLRGDVVRWTEGSEPGALLELSDRCRALAVPAGDGGTRTGYACLP